MSLEPPASSPGGGWRRNVAAVVLDAKGNVLVGRKSSGSRYVHFPQGGVKRKEDLEQALYREMSEETGLSRQSCRIVARLGGLKYRYRSKNRKREEWKGQEQTYFLVRCEGVTPDVDPSHSPEFSSLSWLPCRELAPSLFVSFKRKVIARVLEAFFPKGARDIEAHIASLAAMESCCYKPGLGLASHAPDDRSLFGGGKAEAQVEMQELARRIVRSQRERSDALRLLVILLGPSGSGRNNCLRHIAPCLDPLLTRFQTPHEVARSGQHS